MKTLTIFFYLLLGLNQSEVNEQIQSLELSHRQSIFAGEPATYIYDNDIVHVISFRDSVVVEVGAFIPKEYYENYQEHFDSLFIRVGDEMFYYENYRIAFFKAVDPGRFVVVAYEGGEYDD